MDSNTATNPDQNEDLKQVIDTAVDPLIGVSEELELVVSTKIGNLSKVVDDIEKLEQTAYADMKKIVKDKETSMLNVLENKFQEYQILLEKKKDELKNNITSHFRNLGESVLVRHNPSDQQYEAKGKIVEWKNMVKKKMDKWSTVKNMDVANEIIEEDETAVGPEINVWAKKIENLLTAENKEILVDKSFLVFDEDFPKAVASLCEYRVINEESLFEKIMKGDSNSNQLVRTDSEKEIITERNQLFEIIFKAYSFSADISTQGLDTIKLTPTTSFFSPDKSKIKSEVEKLSNISSVKVQCTDFKTKTLPNFSQALLLFSHLKELHITLEFCEKLTDYALELLGSCYAGFPQLQSLHLNLQSDCSKVSAFGFHCLIEKICSLQKLSQLSLSLGSFPNITEIAFSDSIYTLRDLSNLKDLKLGFPTLPTISDNGITRLSSLLERSNDLCSLDLSLCVDSKLTDKGFIRLCDSISLHKDLTNLKINLKDKVSGVTGQGFSCFVKTVSKLRVLNNLSIGLPEAHITNEEFTKFANVLAQSACLKSVSVNFAWTHVNDIGLFDFCAVMGSLVYLEDLSLNFKACSISNEGFCEVAKGVTKLFNLNRLELDMSWCKDITDKGLEYFGEEVQKMKGLSRLLLRFEESKKITEAGMIKLCGQLASLDTLTNLQIHLVKCGRDLVEDRSKDKMEQALVSKRRHFIKNIWIVE